MSDLIFAKSVYRQLEVNLEDLAGYWAMNCTCEHYANGKCLHCALVKEVNLRRECWEEIKRLTAHVVALEAALAAKEKQGQVKFRIGKPHFWHGDKSNPAVCCKKFCRRYAIYAVRNKDYCKNHSPH